MRDGVIMKLEFRLTETSRSGDQGNNWVHKYLWFNDKRSDPLCLCRRRWRLGTDADTRRKTR
jgi:hypothetical protein